MKKIVSLVLVISVMFLCVFILKDNNRDVLDGNGSIGDPYVVRNADEIEKELMKYYESGVFISDNLTKVDENLYVDNIVRYGKTNMIDVGLLAAHKAYDKGMQDFLEKQLSENKNIVTSSEYLFDFSRKPFKSKKTITSSLTKRMAEAYENNENMIVVSYKIQIKDKWYKANTLIIEK